MLENKAGAAGAVGAQFVATAKPDGYTLLTHIVSISGFAAVDKLFGRTPKFTNADFIPLARIVADPIVLIANKDLPYKTLKDLVADAKANPEQADLQLVRPLRRARTFQRCCLPNRPATCRCGICRPMAAARR